MQGEVAEVDSREIQTLGLTATLYMSHLVRGSSGLGIRRSARAMAAGLQRLLLSTVLCELGPWHCCAARIVDLRLQRVVPATLPEVRMASAEVRAGAIDARPDHPLGENRAHPMLAQEGQRSARGARAAV